MPPWIRRIPVNFHKFPIFGAISLVSFSTSTPKISIVDYLVNQHNFSPECASKVSSSSSTKYINKPLNADSVLKFLKEAGFSKNHIEAIVQKGPWVLSDNLETRIKPKIMVFQDLRFHSSEFTDIISASPSLLRCSADRLRLSILGLKNVLGPNADICRLFKTSGGRWLLDRDLERSLVPTIEYLKSCGICSLLIDSYVCRAPLIFLSSQEKLKGLVQRVDEMGVERESRMFFQAIRALGSMSRENWELKLKLFRDLGFSEQNILYAFRIYPLAFAVSERKIKEVTQLLFSVEDLGISDIVRYPVTLTFSVEKRLKPRVRVLKALQSKNLLKKKLCGARFCQISDADFINKYVIPYKDEVGDLYVASQGS
ncbi:transcription termination factor MTERF8, chloroplastic-like [Euphorbia lathyris]|uniref:transcription termination factor MTERF8, chloroplastic-like n=1 Tax=Euphorbia lathyris TaxID=212925 RepID=UPI003313643C